MKEEDVRKVEERIFEGLVEAYSGINVAVLNLKVGRYSRDGADGEEGIKEIRFKKIQAAVDNALEIFISCNGL